MTAGSAFERRRWWVVFGSVLAILSSNGPVVVYSFGIFLKPIAAEFGWDRRVVSSALTVSLVLMAIATPLVGKLVDRFGVRSVTLSAITLFSLAIAALALTPASPVIFIALYAILGITGAGQAPLPYVKAISCWFDAQRGMALGLAMAGVGAGAALIPQLAQFLITTVGWRGAYVGLGLVTFLLSFPSVAFFVCEPDRVRPRGGRAAPVLPGLTMGEAARSSRFWLIASGFLLASLSISGTIVHMVPLLTDRGISSETAALTVAASGLALIAGRIVAGYALDRIFAPFVAAFFCLTPIVGIMLLWLGLGGQWPFIGAILLGAGLGAEVDLIAFLTTRYLGLRAFGEIYGYLFAIFSIGAGFGPLAMAVSFDETGSYNVALIASAIGLFLAAVLILRLGPYVFQVAETEPEIVLTPSAGTSS